MRSKLASSGASNDVISSSELPTSSQAGSKGLGGMRFAALNSSSFIKKKSNKLGMDDSFAEVNNGEIQTQYELSRLDPDVIDIHRPNSRSPV
ncbi:hypothetical protein VKT23_008038 [Stygiomarasmius scandens]|uniref:Uncharacterized protein n=1 Tax=Marasmiellus scandens TaxID=2682957 RepID=A0ABR1JQB3_9AGAR